MPPPILLQTLMMLVVIELVVSINVSVFKIYILIIGIICFLSSIVALVSLFNLHSLKLVLNKKLYFHLFVATLYIRNGLRKVTLLNTLYTGLFIFLFIEGTHESESWFLVFSLTNPVWKITQKLTS